jgi:RND family efflux transporter MFP subunit
LLEQQTALLQLADNAVNRSKKLEQSRLASQSTLDDAQANKQRQMVTLKQLNFDIAEHPARNAQIQAQFKGAQSLLKQAEVDLERTKVTAPFSGRISQLNVSIGERVRTGDTLLSLYDLDNLEVRAQIPGRYINQVHNMMNLSQVLEAKASLNQQSLAFKLERLSGEVKIDSGGIDGLFSISGNQSTIALGTFIELKLKLAQQNDVVALPFNALYGLDHVYRIKDGYLQSVSIERVGESTNNQGQKQLLLRSQDLHQGDQIVSTQLPNAITGLRVEALSE